MLANYEVFEDSGGVADIEYTVNRQVSGGFKVSRDHEEVVAQATDEAIRYSFIYFLEKLITIDLQTRRKDLYFVHAAALERQERVMMIVAKSGAGKSTTTWALLQHGFNYLSDELVPIDPVNLDVYPYPHALCLKASPPGPYPLPEKIVQTERTIHIPVTKMPSATIKTPKPLCALFFLQRDSNISEPDYTELSPAEAGARLYVNTLNALAHPDKGLDYAIKIAGAVPAFVINAGDLQATCELISSLDETI